MAKNELSGINHINYYDKGEETFSGVLTKQVVAFLNTPEGAEKATELLIRAGTSSIDIFKSFLEASEHVACEQLNTVREIYKDALQKEIEREARELDSYDQLVKSYNDKIDQILAQLDLNSDSSTQNAIYMIRELRHFFLDQSAGCERPSLFQRRSTNLKINR